MFLFIQGGSLSLQVITPSGIKLRIIFLTVLLSKVTFSLTSIFVKRIAHGNLSVAFF